MARDRTYSIRTAASFQIPMEIAPLETATQAEATNGHYQNRAYRLQL
jgi:hypothetical protein